MGGLIESVFGSTTDQGQTQQTNFNPQDLARLRSQLGSFQQQTGGFQNLAGQLQRQAAGAVPSLQTSQIAAPQTAQAAQLQLQGPQFSNQLDALSQGLVSQGIQAQQQQAAAQAAAARRQAPGSTGNILARQIQAQSALQQNPLLFQAAQGQSQRELGQQGLIQQAQQAANQARLSQAQQSAEFGNLGFQQQLASQQALNQALQQQFGLGQQSRQEQLGLRGAGLQAGGGLVAMLSQLAEQTAQKQAGAESTRGGLFGGGGFLGLGL